MILLYFFISMVTSECLPGSSECDGNLMKVCELGGAWVEINCPDNTACGLDDNKITCKFVGQNNGQNDLGQGQPEQNNGQVQPEQNNEQVQPEQNNGQGQPDQNDLGQGQPEQNNNIGQNQPDQNASQGQSNQNNGQGQPSNEGTQEQPGNNNGETQPNGNQEQSNIPENQQGNNQQPNGGEQNIADDTQKPPNETTPAISENKDSKKTVYVVQTVTEKEPTDEGKEIEKAILNKLKDANLPCCDEDLSKSCRICKDSRPIRAIVIDRESLLGNDQKPQEQISQQPADQMGQAASQPQVEAQNGGTQETRQSDMEQPQMGESPQNGGQQSSGPPKKTNFSKSTPSSSKFLSNNNYRDNSHGIAAKKEMLNDKMPKPTKSEALPHKPNISGNLSPEASGGGGDGGKITAKEIETIAQKLDEPPRKGIIDALEKVLDKIKGRSQQAMFIAQLFHESDGLKELVEIGCDKPGANCGKNYDDGTGAPGKEYYGRGLIQLSWAKNYSAAGKGLGMGDQLLKDPDQVAKNNDIAAKTAVWYWNTHVATRPGVKEMKFGATTKAINGVLECNGSNVDKSKARWKKYLVVAEVVKPSKKATEDGCY